MRLLIKLHPHVQFSNQYYNKIFIYERPAHQDTYSIKKIGNLEFQYQAQTKKNMTKGVTDSY